ncbi:MULTISPECIES: fimbrial protein [Pseudocitrobacter]|uniref:fimbrial protein n=1 Tax=Pseudocitrobacter TaxID=1504576 RepID=UPI000D379C0D|nr:fimbrial protein [Pseudocitrobacter sp. RIT 415]RAU40742.1 fimbrial protein [Pseudocitrobacter sp. RIT 415]UYW72575.1 fimbrial protein [Pseudocitrobacter faecalis]
MFYQRITLFFLFVATNISCSLAGPNSLTLTARTTVTASTCTAELHNAQDQLTTTIDLGDVYLNELANKSKTKSFSLVFSQCEGLVKHQASVTLSPQTGCDGSASTGGGYRNALSGSDAATGASAEVWTTNQPEGAGALQLHCKTPPTTIVDVSQASGASVTRWPLSARMVIAANSTLADVNAGKFSTHAVFTVTYE